MAKVYSPARYTSLSLSVFYLLIYFNETYQRRWRRRILATWLRVTYSTVEISTYGRYFKSYYRSVPTVYASSSSSAIKRRKKERKKRSVYKCRQENQDETRSADSCYYTIVVVVATSGGRRMPMVKNVNTVVKWQTNCVCCILRAYVECRWRCACVSCCCNRRRVNNSTFMSFIKILLP
jgi:hypothetical protein